jgi:hypothetical protein
VATVSEGIMNSLRFQRDHTTTSPMYRYLFGLIIDDIERDGPCELVLRQTPPDVEPLLDALPLRFLGGVHRIVLEGRAPDLASCYPSVGGHFDPAQPDDAGERFLAAVMDHFDECVDSLSRSVQTNEVGRCAALLVGFLEVARETGLPLRVLEVGASAGLNLRWDRYRYEGGDSGSAWGHSDSPLRFEDVYVDPLPDLAVEAVVAERLGCDRSPIDAASSDGSLTLRSFVWPDQLERFAALDAALQLARTVPVQLERADAGEWVERQLATAHDGVATVLYHSIVWQYLPVETRRQVTDAIERAGASASDSAPIAWLRMEPGRDPTASAEVTLTRWPDGREAVVARTGYHGRPVHLGGSPWSAPRVGVAPPTSS